MTRDSPHDFTQPQVTWVLVIYFLPRARLSLDTSTPTCPSLVMTSFKNWDTAKNADGNFLDNILASIRAGSQPSGLKCQTLWSMFGVQSLNLSSIYSWLSRSFTARGFTSGDPTKGKRLISSRVTKLPQRYNKNTCLTLVKHSCLCLRRR